MKNNLKIVVLVFTIIIAISLCLTCRPPRSHVIFKTDREYVTTPDMLRWHITSFHEIENMSIKHALTYEGTYQNYHLIRYWIKMLDYPNQCSNFALKEDEFQPDYIYNYLEKDSIDMKYQSQRVFNKN